MKGGIISKGVLWALVGVFVCGLMASAQEVQTATVRFTRRSLSGVTNPWWEAEVALRARGGEAAENVKVGLTVAFERAGRTYYFSQNTKVAIIDRTVRVRFYIPGDVMNAYQLSMTPNEYYVEIGSGRGNDELDRAQYSAGLTTAAKRSEFKSAAKGGMMMLNHTQTPFYSLPETWKDLPSYVLP